MSKISRRSEDMRAYPMSYPELHQPQVRFDFVVYEIEPTVQKAV